MFVYVWVIKIYRVWNIVYIVLFFYFEYVVELVFVVVYVIDVFVRVRRIDVLEFIWIYGCVVCCVFGD